MDGVRLCGRVGVWGTASGSMVEYRGGCWSWNNVPSSRCVLFIDHVGGGNQTLSDVSTLLAPPRPVGHLLKCRGCAAEMARGAAAWVVTDEHGVVAVFLAASTAACVRQPSVVGVDVRGFARVAGAHERWGSVDLARMPASTPQGGCGQLVR
jgi:hypothetical protein